MTKCHLLEFYNKKKLTVNFNGGDISSDAGLLIFREFDKKASFIQRIVQCINDKRDERYSTFSLKDLVSQRFYSILAGYEDCNDANELRKDPIIKAIVNRKDINEDLASQSTLSRLENMVDMHDIYNLNKLLVDLFIKEHLKTKPKSITIDVDGSDIETHGAQQLSLFSGYYDQHMYSPLIISCNGHILDCLLRKGNAHTSWGVIPRLDFIISRLKQAFPKLKITIRIDAGGATTKIYEYCEINNFDYVIGLITNDVLKKKVSNLASEAEKRFKETGEKQKFYTEISYAAKSWNKERRVIVKVEHNQKGSNIRFLVTTKTTIPPQELYEEHYTPRGDFERHIGELKTGFSGNRLSCHSFIANQFRLLLSVLIYEMVEYFSEYCLRGTILSNCYPDTLRNTLIKIGARIKITTRRIWVECSNSYPYKNLIAGILNRIKRMPNLV